MLKDRSNQKELLDLGQYTPRQYQRCLKLLGRVGKLLGGDRITKRALLKLQKRPRTILDVGCGGGQLALSIARANPDIQVTGIDINPDAIAYAKKKSKTTSNITFEKQADRMEGNYDVVMATLVCHHMSDDEIVSFLQDARKIANNAVIINDLHRHPFAWISYAAIAPFLFPSWMVWHDGLLSIRRGFIKKDLETYLSRAGFDLGRCTIERKFPFRWVVTIR
ncbi:MAG: methyltransferase domain-containing protein [Waddliaceae bacterium]